MPQGPKRHINQPRVEPYSRAVRRMAARPTTSRSYVPQNSAVNDRNNNTAIWTPEADKQLLEARNGGLSWKPIAETYFRTKTPNACRKRYERLIEKQTVENWDSGRAADLARAYSECREKMWSLLAERMGESKWNILEEKCMEKGVKQLLQLSRRQNREGQLNSAEEDEYDQDSHSQHSRHSSQQTYPEPNILDDSGYMDGTPGRGEKQHISHSASPSTQSHSPFSNVGLSHKPPHLPPICSATSHSSYPSAPVMSSIGQRENNQLPGFQASFGTLVTMGQQNPTVRAFTSC